MFDVKLKKNRLILAIFFIVIVIFLSFSLFFITNKDRIEYRLFFVSSTNDKIISERRVVPSSMNKEQKINILVDEFLSGSIYQPFRKNLFPLRCKASKVILDTRYSTLYIDIPANVLFADAKGLIDLDKSIDILEKNIKSNFNGLDNIVVSVGGKGILSEQHKDR